MRLRTVLWRIERLTGAAIPLITTRRAFREGTISGVRVRAIAPMATLRIAAYSRFLGHRAVESLLWRAVSGSRTLHLGFVAVALHTIQHCVAVTVHCGQPKHDDRGGTDCNRTSQEQRGNERMLRSLHGPPPKRKRKSDHKSYPACRRYRSQQAIRITLPDSIATALDTHVTTDNGGATTTRLPL